MSPCSPPVFPAGFPVCVPRRRSRADVYPTGAFIVFPCRQRSWWWRRPPEIGPVPPPGGPGAGREPRGEGVEEPAGGGSLRDAVVRGHGAIPPRRVASSGRIPPTRRSLQRALQRTLHRALHRALHREVVPGGSSAPGSVFGGRKRRAGVSIASLGFSAPGMREPYAAGATGTVAPRGASRLVPAEPGPVGRTGGGATRRERMAEDGDRVVPEVNPHCRHFGGRGHGRPRISSCASIPRAARSSGVAEPVAAAFAGVRFRGGGLQIVVVPRTRFRLASGLFPDVPAPRRNRRIRSGRRCYPARRRRRIGTGSFRI